MTVTCPVCASKSTFKLFSSCNRHGRHVIDSTEMFDFYRCYSCRCVFPKLGAIDDAFYYKYYPKGYYGSNGSEGVLTEILNSFSVRRKYDFIIDNIGVSRQPISLLDVGCGSCAFIKRLDKKRFSPVGTDISNEAGQICRDSGIEFIKGDIRTADVGGRKFDVITLWHVLEHVRDPIGLLKKLSGMLVEGGLIVAAVPDTESLGFNIGTDMWFHTDAPRHLFLPCTETMNYIIGNAGLRVKCSSSEYQDYPLDLLWSVRKSWKKLFIYPFYPIFKLLSRETRIYACENNE